MQGDLLAVELGHVHQPSRLFVKGGKPLAHVVLILDGEVGHDGYHLQVRYLGDGHGVLLALLGGHFHAVAAHAAGIEANVYLQLATVLVRKFGGLAGELKVADQFLGVVLQCIFEFAQGRGAYPDQFALEATLAHHAHFFVAGHGHARHVVLDDRWHDQADAMAIGVGLEHRTQLRLAAELGLQGLNVVVQRGLVDFNPGVAVLRGHCRGAVVQGQRRCGLYLGLQENQAQGQG
ncbi:hypothetical protein D9M71_424290 [compost metagenome]